MQGEKQRVLAYTPIGLGLDKSHGWGTFLFNSSRACNLRCEGCWTSATDESIRRQLKPGADWLYDGTYNVDTYRISVLEALVEKFNAEDGKLVACMSDGEPLIPANYDFIQHLAGSSSKYGLPLLLFTNGALLDEQKLGEILLFGSAGVSYCISMQTGIKERYGDFMLVDSGNSGERMFEKLKLNFDAWRKYDQLVLKVTGKKGISKHGISIHTYIIPEKTTRKDLESVRDIVEELGNVPWTVSTMGTHVSESLSGRMRKAKLETAELVKEFNTGPTATLSFGEREDQKLCSYIAHGYYPFEEQDNKEKGVYGITFNPYYGGQVQTCPYHSMIGTAGWLTLREYLNTVKENKGGITSKQVGNWLETAVKAETMITRAAFSLAGYEHCLMRHSKKLEIDLFISAVNTEMAQRKKEGRLELEHGDYFTMVLDNLEEAIKVAAEKKEKSK